MAATTPPTWGGMWALDGPAALPEEAAIARQRIAQTDPATGLRCTLECRACTRYPVIEWVVSFLNTGVRDAPNLEKIRALDVALPGTHGALRVSGGQEHTHFALRPRGGGAHAAIRAALL